MYRGNSSKIEFGFCFLHYSLYRFLFLFHLIELLSSETNIRLAVPCLEDGDQHQHDGRRISGTELIRLQQEEVYAICRNCILIRTFSQFSSVFHEGWVLFWRFHETVNFYLVLFFYYFLIQIKCASFYYGTFIIPILQDVMFREIRRPKGDPEVLAAQSREQYFKVGGSIFMHAW